MDIIGKASPDEINERNLNGCELYLEKEHVVDTFEETLETIRASDVDITSVHTPHVKYDNYQEAIEKSDEIAQEQDAVLVLHSSYVRPLMANKLMDFSVLESPYGIENHWGFSLPQIERTVFDEGHGLTLDVAHLYVTNMGLYERNLSYLLHNYSDRITQIHFCDSTDSQDGLPIGEGELDMEWTLEQIYKSDYDDSVVVEVPVEKQEESIRRTRELLEKIN